MPELLASYTNKTVFHYKGIQAPPSSVSAWRDFMSHFGSALVGRYGLAEVSQWYFEVWKCVVR
jgi:xylan 1,4-beta-xylosidase